MLPRYIYSSWELENFNYSNALSPTKVFNASILNPPLIFPKYPTSFLLDQPVIANTISFKIWLSCKQESPYLEFRGCNLEGTETFDVTNSFGFSW